MQVVEEIVSLDRSMNLHVDDADVVELVEEDLMPEELAELQSE